MLTRHVPPRLAASRLPPCGARRRRSGGGHAGCDGADRASGLLGPGPTHVCLPSHKHPALSEFARERSLARKLRESSCHGGKVAKRGAPLLEGDRRQSCRRGRATGDPPGPSSHTGEQESGGSTPARGLQDPAPQDEALRHRGRGVSGVVNGPEKDCASRKLTRVSFCRRLWRPRHGVGAMALAPGPDFSAPHLSLASAGCRPV